MLNLYAHCAPLFYRWLMLRFKMTRLHWLRQPWNCIWVCIRNLHQIIGVIEHIFSLFKMPLGNFFASFAQIIIIFTTRYSAWLCIWSHENMDASCGFRYWISQCKLNKQDRKTMKSVIRFTNCVQLYISMQLHSMYLSHHIWESMRLVREHKMYPSCMYIVY